MKIPRWVWRDPLITIAKDPFLSVAALFLFSFLVAGTVGQLVLPHVEWLRLGTGLFIVLLFVRAAVLRACGQPLFGR